MRSNLGVALDIEKAAPELFEAVAMVRDLIKKSWPSTVVNFDLETINAIGYAYYKATGTSPSRAAKDGK